MLKLDGNLKIIFNNICLTVLFFKQGNWDFKRWSDFNHTFIHSFSTNSGVRFILSLNPGFLFIIWVTLEKTFDVLSFFIYKRGKYGAIVILLWIKDSFSSHYSVVVHHLQSEARPLQFNSPLYYTQAMKTCTRCLISLYLSSFFCNVGYV